jgi:hypothetical protein
MRNRIPVVASLFIVLATASVYGQSTVMNLNVPFQFMAGHNQMAAGKYNVNRESNLTHLTVSGPRSENSKTLSIITRLPRLDSKQPFGARLVFDTFGEQKFLSEVWPSGMDDGYLVYARSGRHAPYWDDGLGKAVPLPILLGGGEKLQGVEASAGSGKRAAR